MKKTLASLMIVLCTVFIVSCVTHEHIIGNGPQGNTVVAEKQWYVLFGLVPLNNVDTKAMAGNARDYKIKTETSFIDGLISYFTMIVTVSCRTVEVTK